MQNYDVINLGTNEFFNGPGTLAGYLRSMSGPKPVVVSSNLIFGTDPSLGSAAIRKWSLHNLNGTFVAVIGAISTQLSTTSSPGPDVIVQADTVSALNQVIGDLRVSEPRVSVIILLSTLSTTQEISLVARTVQYLDIILYRSVDDNEPLAQTVLNAWNEPVFLTTSPNVGGPSAFGGSMGRLQAWFDDSGNLLYANDTQVALGGMYPDDPQMWNQVKSEYLKVAALDGKQVGIATQDYGEQALTVEDPYICRGTQLREHTHLGTHPPCALVFSLLLRFR